MMSGGVTIEVGAEQALSQLGGAGDHHIFTQSQNRRQDFVAKHGKYVPSSQVAYKSWESSRLKVKPASTKIINGGQTVKNVITGATPRNSL